MPRFLLPVLALLAFGLNVRADSVVWPPPFRPPTTPIAEFSSPHLDQAQYFYDHLCQAHAHPVDLVFDGDSITDYWQRAGFPLFRSKFGPYNTIDFAIGGDRTQHVLWRVQHGELKGLHPKLAMLMIGTNNLGSNTSQEIADGITQIVQAYRTEAPDMHVLLLGIFPRGHLPTDGARAKIKEINDIISKLDDGQHVTYLDIGDKFLAPDGTLAPDVMPDFLHPSLKGYQIWADAIQPMLDKYCPLAQATRGGFQALTQPQVQALLTPLSFPFPATPPAGTSTAVFPIPRADYLYRVLGNIDNIKKAPRDLVFDGDSITDFWQSNGAGVLHQRFGKLKVFDNAIAGDQVQQVLWRVQNGDLDGQDPKLIMLMVGTNNGGQKPEEIAGGIKLVIGEYEKRCPSAQVLLLGVFPRGAKPTDPLRGWIKSINAILSTFGSDPRVTYLDIGDKFLQPDGTLTADIMPDFTHPSPKGYTIWADAIQPVIDKYFPNAAAK